MIWSLEARFWGHTFLNSPPGIFRCFTLSLEISDKTRLYPQKLHKIMLHPSEILRPKTKIPGNCTWFFLDDAWKFDFVFNKLLENLLCYFLSTPGNSVSSNPSTSEIILQAIEQLIQFSYLSYKEDIFPVYSFSEQIAVEGEFPRGYWINIATCLLKQTLSSGPKNLSTVSKF